MIESYGPIKLI